MIQQIQFIVQFIFFNLLYSKFNFVIIIEKLFSIHVMEIFF